MALIKQTGPNPYSGQVNTTMGMRENRPPLCHVCGGRREHQIYTINPNGQQVCADCAGRVGVGVLYSPQVKNKGS